MHIENMLRVADFLERQVDGCFNMSSWLFHKDIDLGDEEDSSSEMSARTANRLRAHLIDKGTMEGCGTVACIAGWTAFLFAKETVYDIESFAQETLGLSDEQINGPEGLGGLFYSGYSWPDGFGEKFDKAATPAEKAKVAAAYMRHMVAQEQAALATA